MPDEAKDTKVLFAKKKREAEVNIMFQWSFVDSIFIMIKLQRKNQEKLSMNVEFSKISKLTTIILVSAYCTLALASDHLSWKSYVVKINEMNIKARKAEPD